MKNILCLFLLAGTLAAQAQTPANDLLRHVPADADQVIDVNLGSISSKIDLPSLIGILGSHSKSKSFSIVQHLLTAGIDLHQNIIVAQTNSDKPDSTKYVTFVFHITDSAKFGAFIRANGKEGEPLHYLHPMGKIRVAARGHQMDAWTDKLAVLLVETPPANTTSTPQAHAIAQTKAARRVAAALTGFTNTKFITDTHFATAFADGGDAHIWSHSKSLMSLASKLGKISPEMAQLGMLSQLSGQGKAQKNSESIATLRFDNGSISYSTLKFMSPAEIAAVQRDLGQGLNPELLALVPPHQLIGVVSAHIDMAAMEDSLKKMPSFGMIDTMAQSKGLNIWDIIHALKGDFMLLVCGPDKPATVDSSGKTKVPPPSLYLVASITSKAAFEKIVPMVKFKDATTAGADTVTTDTAHSKNPFPYYVIKNDLAVFGKRHRVNEFFTSGATGEPVGKLLPEELTRNNALNIILDFHALADGLLGPTLNAPDASAKSKAAMNVLQTFQTLQISVGAIRGDAMETRVELDFTDKSKNSLTTLMNLVGSLGNSSLDVR